MTIVPRLGHTSHQLLATLHEGGPATARDLSIGLAHGTVRTALWRLEERGYVKRHGQRRQGTGKRPTPLWQATDAGRDALRAQAVGAIASDLVLARVCGYLTKAARADMTDAGSKTLAAMALADLRGIGEQDVAETEAAA